MGAFKSLITCPTTMTLVFILPFSASALDHPYADRLFVIADQNETFHSKRGFTANCGGNVKQFFEITLDESKTLEREFIVLAHDLGEAERRGLECFSDSGDFGGCELADFMTRKVHDGWVTCKIIRLTDPKPSQANDILDQLTEFNSSQTDDLKNQLTNVLNHIKAYLLPYTIGAALVATSGIIGTIAYHMHRKIGHLNLELAKLKPDRALLPQ